jgi:hypothetical protein
MNKQRVHFLPKHNEGFECFGLCPMCGHADTLVNANGYEYAVCQEHMVKWCIGRRRGSQHNAWLIATYREINPFWPISDVLPDEDEDPPS